MLSDIRKLLLLVLATSLFGCAGETLREDFGKSVSRNEIRQVVNPDASKEIHPDVKMDGQKAVDVVDNYRKETPEADMEDLTD